MKRLAAALCLIAGAAAAQSGLGEALEGYRAEAGLPELERADPLDAAARAHLEDMREAGFFAHEGSGGAMVGQRVRGQGYEWCFVAENLAKGQRSAEQVISSWDGSPGHRRNMRSRDATEYGAAHAGDLWVLVLARPC